MKANPLACALLVLLAVAVQLPFTSAAQTNTRLPDFGQVQLPAQQPSSPSDTNAIIKERDDPLGIETQQPISPTNTNATATNKSRPLTDAEVGLVPDTFVPDNSIETLKVRADKGDASALEELGCAYRDGEVVGRDLEKAETFFWKAYAASNFWAHVDLDLLADAYTKGAGVPKNVAKAIKIYKKLIESGSRFSFFGVSASCLWADELARIYESGDGVPKDMAEATKWYRKAAEQGDAYAQYSLAWAYEEGVGVETNAVEAIKWYQKAAEQGVTAAEFSLGLMYYNGKGVPQDYSEALKWNRKAANQGNIGSQNNLGVMYAKGQGVPQDYVEAYKWYNLAAAQGNTNAIDNRDSIVRHMTPSQIAEAQRLSREFKPRQESGSDNSASPDNPTATGTGFFITDDGYLISNYHVVKDAAQIRLLTRTGTIPAKVVQVDEANDIALLKAEGRFAPLPIASSRTVKLGGTVVTVGFPNIGLQGFSPKLAKGEIASLSGVQDDPRYFQISVPVQPGNSGGALVDERGNVIGIVSAKLDASVALAASGALPENVNYAVKSSFLLSFLESVPDVSAKMKAPNTQDEKFEDVVKSAQQAAVLVLVY
jgi:TPR repeat protein